MSRLFWISKMALISQGWIFNVHDIIICIIFLRLRQSINNYSRYEIFMKIDDMILYEIYVVQLQNSLID